MGKKGLKVYTKVCTKYNTLFEGFAVPQGAIIYFSFVTRLKH